MAHAITHETHTVIYGPGDSVAGAFDHGLPLDDDPESKREVAEDDAVLRDAWVHTLHQHEAAILAAADETERERLRTAVERTAYARLQLTTLDGVIDRVLVAGGVTPSERHRAFLRRLLLGGRAESTWRRWQSGAQLVPIEAASALARLRLAEIVASDEPDGPGRRLRIEYLIDD